MAAIPIQMLILSKLQRDATKCNERKMTYDIARRVHHYRSIHAMH